MLILKKLKAILDEAKVSYEVYTHPLAYTAQEIAEKQHVSGKELAKVVMLEVDEKLVMGVIPGSLKVHVNTARTSLGASTVRLATEDEFVSRFPECEIGAIRPLAISSACRSLSIRRWKRRIYLFQRGQPCADRPHEIQRLCGVG